MDPTDHIAFCIKFVPDVAITPELLNLADCAAKQEILQLLASSGNSHGDITNIPEIYMLWILTDAQGEMRNTVVHRDPVIAQIPPAPGLWQDASGQDTAPEILVLDPAAGTSAEALTNPHLVHQIFFGIGDANEEGLQASNPLLYVMDVICDTNMPDQERVAKLTALGILGPEEIAYLSSLSQHG